MNEMMNKKLKRVKHDVREINDKATAVEEKNFDSQQMIQDSKRNLKRTRKNFVVSSLLIYSFFV